MYKLFNVDFLSSLSINKVITNLKVDKVDYDPKERRLVPNNKRLVRDIAF